MDHRRRPSPRCATGAAPVDPARGEALGNGLLLGRLTSTELDDPALLLQTARLLCASLPRPDRGAAAPVLRSRPLRTFTSNIQKGGALLDDARRVVEVWDLDQDASWNLTRIAEQNLLAKPSRARADDVLLRVLRPRLVEPGPQVIAALKQLLPSPRGFTDAYYFEATRDDALLAAFAEGPLFEWWERGRSRRGRRIRVGLAR